MPGDVGSTNIDDLTNPEQSADAQPAGSQTAEAQTSVTGEEGANNSPDEGSENNGDSVYKQFPDVKPEEIDDILKYVMGAKNIEDLSKVTKSAAERINIGLIVTVYSSISRSAREQAHLRLIDDVLFTSENLTAMSMKDMISLRGQVIGNIEADNEYARKYILNNRGALDAFGSPAQKLMDKLGTLPQDKLLKLSTLVDSMIAEGSADTEINEDGTPVTTVASTETAPKVDNK